jgi:uncharacterized membrane protein YeaQ/YmgE (transglycosylase-associated protein family)
MDLHVTTIIWLVAGGLAGWLAAKILKRTFLGAAGDIAAGMLGGFVGASLWTLLSPPGATIDEIKAVAAAAAGGVAVVVVWRVLRALSRR